MATRGDLTGERFGRLAVIKYAGTNNHRESLWECKCDCGGSRVVRRGSLTSGDTSSCGCFRKEVMSTQYNGLKHGMSKMRFYDTWKQMLQRCTNTNNANYRSYGGRGITVCDKWQTFEGFWEDMQDSYSDNLTIDRIDVNGNYEPDNCRWATRKTQRNNTRFNRFLTFYGLTLTLKQFSEKYGMSSKALDYRLKKGWDIEKALLTPIGSRRKRS
jgi:hypothetical protein